MNKHTSPLLRTTQILTLGILCVAASFAVGIHTAGDVRTVGSLQANTVERTGDINGDEIFNEYDVIEVLHFVSGYAEPTEAQRKADPTDDGQFTTDDAVLLLHDLAARK